MIGVQCLAIQFAIVSVSLSALDSLTALHPVGLVWHKRGVWPEVKAFTNTCGVSRWFFVFFLRSCRVCKYINCILEQRYGNGQWAHHSAFYLKNVNWLIMTNGYKWFMHFFYDYTSRMKIMNGFKNLSKFHYYSLSISVSLFLYHQDTSSEYRGK